jgi:hypothetical protein
MKDPLDPFDLDAALEQQNKAGQLKKQQREEDFKWLMKHPQFRRFMWRQLEQTGVYRTTFRPNSEMAFLEGVRSVGVRMLGECHQLALKETFLMMQEMQSDV